MMNRGHVTEHYTAYLEGSLPDALRREVEAHLASCPRCAAELEETRHMVAVLREIPEQPLPDGFADGVRARLDQRRRPHPFAWLYPALGAGTLTMVAVAIMLLHPPASDRQVVAVTPPATQSLPSEQPMLDTTTPKSPTAISQKPTHDIRVGTVARKADHAGGNRNLSVPGEKREGMKAAPAKPVMIARVPDDLPTQPMPAPPPPPRVVAALPPSSPIAAEMRRDAGENETNGATVEPRTLAMSKAGAMSDVAKDHTLDAFVPDGRTPVEGKAGRPLMKPSYDAAPVMADKADAIPMAPAGNVGGVVGNAVVILGVGPVVNLRLGTLVAKESSPAPAGAQGPRGQINPPVYAQQAATFTIPEVTVPAAGKTNITVASVTPPIAQTQQVNGVHDGLMVRLQLPALAEGTVTKLTLENGVAQTYYLFSPGEEQLGASVPRSAAKPGTMALLQQYARRQQRFLLCPADFIEQSIAGEGFSAAAFDRVLDSLAAHGQYRVLRDAQSVVILPVQ